uniref:TauD domain-containing protein n=1 Tax=Caenorhabditis tropicalis TaxID=1561998 RepID=A0A1I7UQQ5_9PELO
MLHMLQSAEEGGNSLFVDGFHVAEQLRKENPEVFRILTTQSMEYIEEGYDVHEINGKEFRFDYDMCARHKVIRLNDEGKVNKIQYGNAMRSWFYDCEPTKVQDIYRAMKTFTEHCYQPRNILKFRLEDGDTVLWANQRLLHTRDAFKNAPGKSRTLTGCYFDWDIVKSRVRFLRDKLSLEQNQPSA